MFCFVTCTSRRPTNPLLILIFIFFDILSGSLSPALVFHIIIRKFFFYPHIFVSGSSI